MCVGDLVNIPFILLLVNWRIVKLCIFCTIEKRIHEAKPEFTNVEVTLVIHLSWFL